jgi:hypothetical protein
MKFSYAYIGISIMAIVLFGSCKTIEKASIHGLHNGFYQLKTEKKPVQSVYLDITNEKIDIYDHTKQQGVIKRLFTIHLQNTDSLLTNEMVFKKQGLDIDITSILLKYRPSIHGLPAQLSTDLNMALYIGWRYDKYHIITKQDPLEKRQAKIGNMGYDVGFFAGPGATIINPFTTNNRRLDEYSGMIIQTGVAAFIESNVASFGLAIGVDYLMNQDRKVWIYHKKPWLGFVVGIALN